MFTHFGKYVLVIIVGIIISAYPQTSFAQRRIFRDTPTPTPQPTTIPPTATPVPISVTPTAVPTQKVNPTAIPTPTPVPQSSDQSAVPTPTAQPMAPLVIVTPTPKPAPHVNTEPLTNTVAPVARVITAPFDLVKNILPKSYYAEQGLQPRVTLSLVLIGLLMALSGTILLLWPYLMRAKTKILAAYYHRRNMSLHTGREVQRFV